MLLYKIGFFVLPATILLTLSTHISNAAKYVDSTLACLYIISGVIAGKIIYARHQQVQALPPTVASEIFVANKISSYTNFFLFLGFLIYFLLILYEVDRYFLTALNMFICGFGTLYLWMQSIITKHLSYFYYDKSIPVLRERLTNASSLLLIIMTVFGVVSISLPTYTVGSSNPLRVCFFFTTVCSYMIAAVFSIFILTFDMDIKFFSYRHDGNTLLDDAYSFNNSSADSETLLIQPTTNSLKRSINYIKIS